MPQKTEHLEQSNFSVISVTELVQSINCSSICSVNSSILLPFPSSISISFHSYYNSVYLTLESPQKSITINQDCYRSLIFSNRAHKRRWCVLEVVSYVLNLPGVRASYVLFSATTGQTAKAHLSAQPQRFWLQMRVLLILVMIGDEMPSFSETHFEKS